MEEMFGEHLTPTLSKGEGVVQTNYEIPTNHLARHRDPDKVGSGDPQPMK